MLSGEATEATRKFLWDFLEDVELVRIHNSGRGKTLTVLTRIWNDVPEQAEPLKRAALECVAATTGQTRIAVHWAMVAGTHPFFSMWLPMWGNSLSFTVKQIGHRLNAG